MAKGNNGNALQHLVELACVEQLLSSGEGLRFLSTHGMAPFENLTDAEKHDFDTSKGTRLLARLLRLARESRKSGTADARSIVRAFTDLKASGENYPNSTVLVEWAAAQAKKPFVARVIEKEAAIYAELKERWPSDPSVALIQGTWRNVLRGRDESGHEDPLRKLDVPGFPPWPWLWSMDPYTFVLNEDRRDAGDLSASDLQSLGAPLARAFGDGSSGVFVVFCYSMDSVTTAGFRAAFQRLRSTLAPAPVLKFLGIEKNAATIHLAAMLSNCPAALDYAEKILKMEAGDQFRQ